MLASLAEDGRIRAAENVPKEIAKLAYSVSDGVLHGSFLLCANSLRARLLLRITTV